VASFLGSTGAVLLVSTMHATTGFSGLFLALAAVAALALVAALMMPRIGEPKRSPAVPA